MKMALFKLKKHGKDNQQKAQDGQLIAAKRPTESLGSVLSESVPGASLDISGQIPPLNFRQMRMGIGSM